MDNRGKKKFILILLVIFFGFRVFMALMEQDTHSYNEIQPENFTKSPIDQVLISNEQLYVCYDDFQIVNVYDLSGNFLWSIDAPSMRNCRFQLLDDMLVVYNYSTALAYTYDAQSGEYLGVVTASKLELSYKYAGDHPPVKELDPGEIGWDDFNVYRMDADGPVKLVSRPWWYYLTHPTLTWAIGFFSILTIFTIQVIKKFRHEDDIDPEELPSDVRKKAAFFKGYALACGANTLLNILIIPFYPAYILASFVLTAVFVLWVIADTVYHFIVSRGFFYVGTEHPYAEKWYRADFVSLIISTLSAVAVLMLTN